MGQLIAIVNLIDLQNQVLNASLLTSETQNTIVLLIT